MELLDTPVRPISGGEALAAAPSSARVWSVDVLRGLVMFAMVFVNDVAGWPGVPRWMEHYQPYDASGMTFVDLVFPAFLFIVGMSIPLAISTRRARRESWLRIYGHVLLRTASLLFVGVLMVDHPDAAQMGWPAHLWSVLMFAGAIAAFHSIRTRRPAVRITSLAIRALGLALLIYLAIAFRNKSGGHLRTEWWGILGLIGWAYLVATTVYLLLRREGLAALVGAVGVLMCVFFADHAGGLGWLKFNLGSHTIELTQWIGFGSMWGSHASITMGGVVLGAMLLPASEMQSPAARIRFAAVFTILLVAAALLLHKTFGINKNAATPSWCFWSMAITTVLWIVLYAAIDVAGLRTWSIPLAWAGTNALLIYLLHPLWIHLVGLSGWQGWSHFATHYPAVAYRSLAVAAVLCLIGGGLAKLGFRLRL